MIAECGESSSNFDKSRLLPTNQRATSDPYPTMTKNFDKNFAGLQIKWQEDDEIEYIGTAILNAPPSQAKARTAAACKINGKEISYLYPVHMERKTQSRLELRYIENPAGWSRRGWELVNGVLAIHFNNDNEPIEVVWHEEGNIPEQLQKGKDWEYKSKGGIDRDRLFQPRGRVLASKLERPRQQFLRNLLISERGGCLVTGTECAAVLEACHIVPVKNGGPDSIENALLLRRDIHALFDAGLLRFQSNGHIWTVELSPRINDQAYTELLGGKKELKIDPSSSDYLEARAKLEEQTPRSKRTH